MRYVLSAFGAVLLLVALIAGGFALRYYIAGPSGRVAATEQIQSGSHRIVAYNHFFDLCAGVRADEVSLDAQNAQLLDTTDPFQRTRVQTNITGLIGHRAGLIEEYNANARKGYTEGQFRDSNLPYQLRTESYAKGEKTSCGS